MWKTSKRNVGKWRENKKRKRDSASPCSTRIIILYIFIVMNGYLVSFLFTALRTVIVVVINVINILLLLFLFLDPLCTVASRVRYPRKKWWLHINIIILVTRCINKITIYTTFYAKMKKRLLPLFCLSPSYTSSLWVFFCLVFCNTFFFRRYKYIQRQYLHNCFIQHYKLFFYCKNNIIN